VSKPPPLGTVAPLVVLPGAVLVPVPDVPGVPGVPEPGIPVLPIVPVLPVVPVPGPIPPAVWALAASGIARNPDNSNVNNPLFFMMIPFEFARPHPSKLPPKLPPRIPFTLQGSYQPRPANRRCGRVSRVTAR
jgi:hypothetical protein